MSISLRSSYINMALRTNVCTVHSLVGISNKYYKFMQNLSGRQQCKTRGKTLAKYINTNIMQWLRFQSATFQSLASWHPTFSAVAVAKAASNLKGQRCAAAIFYRMWKKLFSNKIKRKNLLIQPVCLHAMWWVYNVRWRVLARIGLNVWYVPSYMLQRW